MPTVQNNYTLPVVENNYAEGHAPSVNIMAYVISLLLDGVQIYNQSAAVQSKVLQANVVAQEEINSEMAAQKFATVPASIPKMETVEERKYLDTPELSLDGGYVKRWHWTNVKVRTQVGVVNADAIAAAQDKNISLNQTTTLLQAQLAVLQQNQSQGAAQIESESDSANTNTQTITSLLQLLKTLTNTIMLPYNTNQ